MKKRKTKMGRPPLPPEERKAHVLHVRVTDADMQGMYRRAKARGLSMTEWVRERLLGDER